MPIGSLQNYRIVRRDPVQIPTRGKYWRRPEGFNPSATGDPLTRLCLIYFGLNLSQKVLEVGDALEVERHFAKADIFQMVMRVGHSRDHGRADACYRSARRDRGP